MVVVFFLDENDSCEGEGEVVEEKRVKKRVDGSDDDGGNNGGNDSSVGRSYS